ncbi:MAG: hypothetical protein EOO59_14565, partial [Hymenobacter sp.]
MHRYQPATGGPQLLVLHRQSGQPLAGVSARATYQRYDRANRQPVRRRSDVLLTNALGIVELPAAITDTGGQPDEQVPQVQVWRGTDTLAVKNMGSYYAGNQRDDTDTKCFLFTDRAIYRPGQTVYFKGILVETQGGKTRLLTKAEQEV